MNSHVRFAGDYREQNAPPRAMSVTPPVKTLTSMSLFEGTKEIAIEHGESVYRLKITRQGKLILNK